MGNHFRRLDRIEAAAAPRYPWDEVCYVCARKGLSETPYEHCEAKRCADGKRAWGARFPDEASAAPMREAFERGCIKRGTTVQAEMEKDRREDQAKREAWAEKKRAMREERYG